MSIEGWPFAVTLFLYLKNKKIFTIFLKCDLPFALLEYKKFITIDSIFFDGSKKKREKNKITFMWLSAGPDTVNDRDACGDRKTAGFQFWNFLFNPFRKPLRWIFIRGNFVFSQWQRLASHESSGRPRAVGPNGESEVSDKPKPIPNNCIQ